MKSLLIAASLASLPICTVDGKPMSAEDYMLFKMVVLADDTDAAELAENYLGPGTKDWTRCIDKELSNFSEDRRAFSSNEIATAAVDVCVLESDNYKLFISRVIGRINEKDIIISYENMRLKLIRYYAAIDVSQRAGFRNDAMSASETGT